MKNELRIGNYLSHKHDPVVGKPGLLEVVEVKYNHARVEYQLNGRTRTSCVEYADLEGKQLTEEWLLKFGFEKRGNRFVFLSAGYYGDYYVYKTNKTNWTFALANDGGKGVLKIVAPFNCSIKQVHQLQNLYFALTGEELTTK